MKPNEERQIAKSSIPSTIPLHEMDKITYILTAKNSGDGDGTVKISDTVPKGTTLVKDSIKFEDKIYTEAELNEGIDVILGGNEEKTITFTVTINPFKEEKVVIRNTEAKQDGKNIPGTEDEVEKEYVSININKEFVDKDNIDKCRPLEVLFGLYTSEEANAPIKKLTLNEQNNWQGSFTKLDKYDLETKELINYYVKEIEIDKNYTPTYEFIRKGDNITFKFTNTLKYANVTTSVKVKKIWRDNEGKVGARTNVTFELYKDGKPTNITKTATEEINWQVEFSDLQKYHNDGTIIKYTVVEKTKLEHYKEPQYYNLGTEIFVINTIDYTTFYKDIKITKKWVDLKDTIHPDIEISLYQNDKLLKTDTLKSGKTEHTFENLPQYDSAGNPYIYTAQEKEIEEYNTSYSDDKLTITNTIKQDYTVKIEGTKTWEDPEGTTIVHPEITINLIKNGQQTDKKETLQNGELTYCFDNLPKYKTYDNGEYILDDDGNVQLNTYSISEENVANYDTSYNGYDIINTFNQDITGTVKITSTDNSEQSVQTPLDVVFVLDVSGSMNTNDKDKNMISAVNSAISTIMKNPDSKIGVVAFSSTEDSVHSNNANAITLLELGKYTPSTAGEYLTIEDSQYYDDYWKEYYDCDIISTNVNEKNRTSINVYGGTFTQAGIKAGANILTNATTTYTTSVNGKEKTITRTPVMILLSDGDPTYYKTDFGGLGGERKGTGRDTTENEAYYTIKTADYFKQQITSHYYDNTEKASKFYTIGLNMSGTLSQTILDPSKTNVDLCNTEGTNYNNYGLLGRNVKGKLYDKIIQDGSADKYSYADKSYVGTMTTTDLEATFNTIISENSISTEERNITLEESIARKVELKGIDTSKEFELKIGSITYNFETAQSNDYVKGNDTEGYYVDLQDIEKGTSITISYHK